MSSSERSIFVTLAAHGLGYVGFSVSIIAWLWLALVPPKPELTEPVSIDKKARRRSAPAVLPAQARKRESLSPVPAVSASTPSPTANSPRTRRVYFVDSPLSSPSRSTNQIERTPHDSLDFLNKPLNGSPVSEISPTSSSSTLVHTYSAISPQTLETCRESAIESDSSKSSSRASLSLPRLSPKASERPRPLHGTSDSDVAPTTGPAADTRRKSSIGFVPPWAFRRGSGPRNPASASAAPPSATPVSATPVPAQSYFARKTARRVSTPVPRTQPYAYPYFAQPPVEDEALAAQLRSLPQFGAEGLSRGPIASDSEESPLRGRNRKSNKQAQAALGLGRPVRPPQRSASESWAAGKDPRF
ncbi:hypothetical protein B0H15DRAFT_942752 [Mycena belliarum]|uniref:Uncharacterized protein n=1 Tax=Mycena belliarum TaxID=1033014 RepID=A0AAD6UJB2_9AGAR|nr:hypothetical protein B0H15DRAFT_942752 [Mycena belliae]